MTSHVTDCPVCGHPGFERARLPETCPQCGWTVANLLKPSKTYLRKLDTAKKEWIATGGTPQVRAKRLVALFEKIDAAWKAGRWVETLEHFDNILEIDSDNVRAIRERPVALFCLVESLLQLHIAARRKAIEQKMSDDKLARDRMHADALRCESVGMAKEADDLVRQASVLDNRINSLYNESTSLRSAFQLHFISTYQQGGPETVRKDGDPFVYTKLLAEPCPKWMDTRFHDLVWKPFSAQIPNLPVDTIRYAVEFRSAYEPIFSASRTADSDHPPGNEGKRARAVNPREPDHETKEPERVSHLEGRFLKDPSSREIEDTKTGLHWLEGPDKDTSHHEAERWARSLGGRWRLPTHSELLELRRSGVIFDRSGPFSNSGLFIWSCEVIDSSSAKTIITLPSGKGGRRVNEDDDGLTDRSHRECSRAFAVRSG